MNKFDHILNGMLYYALMNFVLNIFNILIGKLIGLSIPSVDYFACILTLLYVINKLDKEQKG